MAWISSTCVRTGEMIRNTESAMAAMNPMNTGSTASPRGMWSRRRIRTRGFSSSATIVDTAKITSTGPISWPRIQTIARRAATDTSFAQRGWGAMRPLIGGILVLGSAIPGTWRHA